ncbi:hypothetical protein WG66_010163 [Moniliophthora roreri]|nr:hypothetical protein WG66_010163 [Moniliophthora roreri]
MVEVMIIDLISCSSRKTGLP